MASTRQQLGGLYRRASSSTANTSISTVANLLYGPKPPYCARCNESFAPYEDMAKTGDDEFWHLRCFVCAQCFRPFNENNEYFEFEGKKYCEQDFKTLFAPCCAKCHEFIIGRFIRAMHNCWHPNCFQCHTCGISLADQGFIKSRGRALCRDCNTLEKDATSKRYICEKCNEFLDEDEQPLKIKNEPYHAYHFNCHSCGIELRPDARQVDNDLYCLKCHDKLHGLPICGACRRPIDNERVVTALGKQFHVDHFACARCEKPFLGKRHYEWKGLAYCETDYYLLFGYPCHACDQIIKGDIVKALDKYWCVQHFTCSFCDIRIVPNKSKFHDVDSRPCCKKCFKKFPREIRKRLAKQNNIKAKSTSKSTDNKDKLSQITD